MKNYRVQVYRKAQKYQKQKKNEYLKLYRDSPNRDMRYVNEIRKIFNIKITCFIIQLPPLLTESFNFVFLLCLKCNKEYNIKHL